MKLSEKIKFAEFILDTSKKYGAAEASAIVYDGFESEYEQRESKIDKLSQAKTKGARIEVYVGKKFASASTNDLRKDSIEKFIKNTIDTAKYLEDDEFRGLPDPKYYPTKFDVDPNIYDKNYSKIKSEEKIKIVEELEKFVAKKDSRIISITTNYSDNEYEEFRLTSNGFSASRNSSFFAISVEVSCQDPSGGKPSGHYYASSRHFKNLPDLKFVSEQAYNRAIKKIGQRKISSGKYLTIVENRACVRLFNMLIAPLYASNVQQKRSIFADKANQKILSDKLTIYDDPFIPGGMGSRIYDSYGIAAKKFPLFEKGVLKNFYVDVYYGRKLKMEPNAASPSNVILEYGARNLDEIIKNIEKGIYIENFIGGNFNSLTGDFSFGVAGYLVEKGTLVQPINEMNISGNILKLFNNVEEIGNDPYPYSAFRIPTVVFSDVDFSGI